MKKKSTLLIATILWAFLLVLNLLNQDYSSFEKRDIISHGVYLAIVLCFLFSYLHEGKKENTNA